MSTCQHADTTPEPPDTPDAWGTCNVLICHACGKRLVRYSDGTLHEVNVRRDMLGNDPHTCWDLSPRMRKAYDEAEDAMAHPWGVNLEAVRRA